MLRPSISGTFVLAAGERMRLDDISFSFHSQHRNGTLGSELTGRPSGRLPAVAVALVGTMMLMVIPYEINELCIEKL